MKESITQEALYGCGIACFAFVANLTYKQAADFLGSEQAKSDRFIVKYFRGTESLRFKLYFKTRKA